MSERLEYGERARAAVGEYLKSDLKIGVGELPLVKYREWHEALAEAKDLTPHENMAAGWLELERMVALIRAEDPTIKNKDIGAAAEASRARFAAVAAAEGTSGSDKAWMKLSSTSVAAYRSWAQGDRKQLGDTAMLRAIKASGQLFFDPEDTSPDHLGVLHSATAIVLLNEKCGINMWAVPAPMRYPWSVNALPPMSPGNYESLTVGTFPQRDDCIHIDTALLGDHTAWPTPFSGATLTVYIEACQPGFLSRRSKNSYSKNKLADLRRWQDGIERLGDGVFAAFKSQLKRTTLIAGKADTASDDSVESAETESTESEPLRPEATWYIGQPSGGIHEMDEAGFKEQLGNFEAALQQGEAINASERHVLGCMQLEHALLLASQGDLETALLRFDDAIASFMAVAEARDESQIGDKWLATFDHEGAVVQKALFAYQAVMKTLEADTSQDESARKKARHNAKKERDKIVDTYLRHLAAFAPKLRDSDKHATTLKQKQLLCNASVTATLALLIANSDEYTRHLVVPTGLRDGGDGEMGAVAYPIDAEKEYDPEPVCIDFKHTEKEIVIKNRRVLMHIGTLIDIKSPFSLLLKVARGKKDKKVPETVVATAQQLADAIFDSTEV